MRKLFILILGLIIISLITYNRWLSFLPFVYGDWGFYFKESLVSNFFPNIWTTTFGDINIVLWNYPLYFFNGIFGNLGFASNISEKFIFFWPIILIAPISSFLLVRKATKSNLAGVIGSLIFSYNTYFLSIDTVGHELLTVGFLWGVFAILTFIYLLETKKRIFIPLTALILFIVGSYDFRSLYVVLGVIGLYIIYYRIIIEKEWRENLKNNFINVFFVFFILILLNLYWLLPFIFAKTLTDNAVLSRQLLVGNFYSLQGAFGLFFPFWTGIEPTWFFVQKIPMYFWLYPILAFSGLLIARKNKQIVFWGLIGLIGIFLTKQDTRPFADIYSFLYAHVPGFSAFREASKFYFLIVLSYSILIGSFAVFIWNYFKNRKYLKYVFVFLIALLPLWNAVPIFTGEIRTMFVPKSIPSDLDKISIYLNTQNEYSKIFWINMDYHWILSTNKHPVFGGTSGAVENWANQADIEHNYLDLSSDYESESQKMIMFYNSDIGRRMLALGSFGHVIISKDKNDWTNPNSKTWDELGNSLKNISHLKQENIGVKNTLLFVNSNQRPHVYITKDKESVYEDVDFNKIGFTEVKPTEYRINVKDINSPFYLNFSDNYHLDWKLYSGKFSWLNILLNKQNILSEKNHFKNVVGFNSFYIDPRIICNAHKSENICVRNPNGSYDISLTLFFRPQAYLYFGLIISAITLLGALFSMIYFYKKKL